MAHLQCAFTLLLLPFFTVNYFSSFKPLQSSIGYYYYKVILIFHKTS